MEENAYVRRQNRWISIALIWLGLGLFDATQTVFVMRSEGMHHAWTKLFFESVVSWMPWALVTPLVLRLGKRFPPAKKTAPWTWLVHITACVLIGLTFAGWTTSLELMLNAYANAATPPFLPAWLDRFFNGMLSSVVLYSAIITAGYVLESSARLVFQQTESARLNEQLSRAQLQALRQQIEPHFLFNALNSVTGLIREGRNDAAVSMIAGLSDFLRRVLRDDSRQQVSLREEMEFVQRYLDIQKVRFADRLQIRFDIDAGAYNAQVPSLILQPLVENAVQHGIAKRAAGGTIQISAFRVNGTLDLSICNDGPPVPDAWEASQSGVGLSNVRSRLRTLYGNSFQLRVHNQEPSKVEVSFSLPFVLAPAREELTLDIRTEEHYPHDRRR